ncbi:MAG: hypothetical protein GC158_13210 [Cyanobacteria bacterium RI_101]|nr:hypothetical protein [Cyanobacteria bacterium RI_101]
MTDSSPRLCVDLAQSPFFCDGHGYLIFSSSLAGATVEEFCKAHYEGNTRDRKALVRRGVYLPLLFDGDCMLDDALIVVGDLLPEEASQAIPVLTWKLNIPCGHLIISAECGEEEYIRRAVQNKREEHYQVFEWVDVSTGDYRVDLYATPPRFILRLSSLTEPLTMPNMEDGWFELPPLGEFFDDENDDDDDDDDG